MQDRLRLGPLVARVALGGVLLYFGVGELWNPFPWQGYIPHALAGLPAVPLLLVHGYLLFAAGALLALGQWTRSAAWLSVFMLASIVVGLYLNGGGTAITVRDLGLLGLAVSLALGREEGFGIDRLLGARAARPDGGRPAAR